jgi:primase-polymerase (primpol)-like protein
MVFMKPEHQRRERFTSYAAMLRERFHNGMLSELQPFNQWVVWRGELEYGKKKKVPYNPQYHLVKARATIPQSGGTLNQALRELETGDYSGLGFIITPPLVMIDLDHSFDKQTRTITDPQAAAIVQELNSYTEASPTNGLHILAYGLLPGKGIHTGIEIYGQDRFTTITTDHIADTPPNIEHRLELLTSLYHRYAPPIEEREFQNTRGGVGNGNALTELPKEAANDPLLQELLRGDISGFQGNQSRADFVLIMKLLHWTGDNIELTRRLFLESPLGLREKAKRKTGETTYVDMTIYNVLRKRRNQPMRR